MATETSSSTNVRINPEKHYGQKVFSWLIEEGENTVCENIDGKNNENIENNENTNTNNKTNNSIFKANSKEKLFQENLFEEENSSQEESTQEETSRSRAGSSSSSSLYTAELVRAHRSVDSSSSSNGSENEISSPIKPLKAITTQTTTTISTNSNVYEILQEIKPEHPLRIHTQFNFATTRPSSISLISLNPLLHHHRNSTYNNPSPTSVSYIPPRRYSNFQRNSFYNNNNTTSLKHPSCIEETDNNNNLTIRQLRQLHATNITQEKNTHLFHEEKIMYGKYLFWVGFLFMPVWWVGCFYKPSSTEDYKWRKRCRKASTWSFVISIVILTLIVVVNQRLKVGL